MSHPLIPTGRWFTDADREQGVGRPASQVVDRIYGLAMISAISHFWLTQPDDLMFELEDAESWLEEHGLPDPFTPAERAWLTGTRSRHDAIQFKWRIEAAWMLAWAVGWMDDQGPLQQSNASDFFYERCFERDPVAQRNEAALIPAYRIWDELDLIVRTHWAIRHHGRDLPGIDSGVVSERHWSLRWLTDPDTNWDDVSLDS